MADKTGIAWASSTWNPITGCTPCSPGCANCYAKTVANRFAGMHGYPADDPFRVTFHPHRMDQPIRWQRPRLIFVCSMSDLFHEDVSTGNILKIWEVMRIAKQHTFLVLTKRARRMNRMLTYWMLNASTSTGELPFAVGETALPNVWLGVTVENQDYTHRINHLIATPAVGRFISVEPMLSEVDISEYLSPDETHPSHGLLTGDSLVDWIICGGESGAKARPMHIDWALNLQKQCREAQVPFFFKQHGEWMPIDHALDNEPPAIGKKLHKWPDGTQSIKVGKKTAGSLLNGVDYKEMPEALARFTR